jgi:biotin operon repressor
MSAKERILSLLKAAVGKIVSRERIIRAADSSEWARRIRDLRAEGWLIKTAQDGYLLKSLEKGAAQDTAGISAKMRYAVLHRDSSRCRRCGRTIDDGVKLAVDHILPRDWGGKTEIDNLWTLCEPCNLGKKNFESDVDAATMQKVLAETSGRGRILEYMKLKVGQIVTKEELIIVSGIHDYPRRIRELRDAGWDIVSMYENPKLRPGDYTLLSVKQGNRR